MKKIFSGVLIVILAFAFCMPVYCNESGTIINPDGTYNQPKKESIINKIKNFFKRDKKTPQDMQGKGYYGKLPDINTDFEYRRETSDTTPKRQYSEKDLQDGLLLDAPLNDPLFLDVIIKKEKTSDYVNDIVKIKETLERLRQCINDNASIQFFNANVNVLDLQTTNLERKYQYSAYAQSNSFYAIRHVNYSAKVLGNLKYDANFYSRYMPLQDSVYSPNNIKAKSAALLDEIDRTIFEIGNAQ